MVGVPVLVMANKQDLPQSYSPSEIAKALGLSRITSRDWRVHGTCATIGEGMHDAIIEFSDMVKKFQNSRKH